MKKTFAAISAALLALLGLSLGAAPAMATEDTTVEVYWAMPNGGTPDNVTYPQSLSNASELECGTWYQADTYLPPEAALFTADGILTLGEDYQTETQRGAISWHFVYGGDCPVVPEKPADGVDTATNEDYDCISGFVTATLTETPYTWTLNEETNTWEKTSGSPIVTKTVRPIDPAAHPCPVITPTPTPSPTQSSTPTEGGSTTPTPSTTSSATETAQDSDQSSATESTDQLADTGFDKRFIGALTLAGSILVGGGIFLIIWNLRRRK